MYTEKIMTLSSELKMFLKIERHFNLKMFLFSSNQVELAVFQYIVCTNKLLVQSLVYTYQKVVK